MSSGPLDVVASLYQLAPEDFVAARARAAAELRADGDELGAARVRRLARPTVAASWVNRISKQWPSELEDLLAVGTALRAATTARDAGELARLNGVRRLRTDALVQLLRRHGEEQAAQGGRAPSSESLTRVVQTLTAAVMDPDVADLVREGTLARTVVHEGFTLLDGDPAGAPDETDRGPTVTLLPVPEPPRTGHPSTLVHGDGDPAGGRPGARADAGGGAAAVERAAAALDDAENDLSAARDTVASLVRMLEVLEGELVSMTRDRDATRANVADWRRKLRDAERRARVARSRLRALGGGDGA